MNLSLDNNVNKFVLLVVCGVIVLLVVNMNKKKLGKQVCTLISILVIGVSGFFGYMLLNQENENFNAYQSISPVDKYKEDFQLENQVKLNDNSLNKWHEQAHLDETAFMRAELEKMEPAPAPGSTPPPLADALPPLLPPPPPEEEASEEALPPLLPPPPPEEGFTTENFEGFQNNSSDNNLDSKHLLPSPSSHSEINPSNNGGILTENFLNAGHHIGVNTQGCSLRNSNRGLRSEPPNPQVQVSPWMQTTICPDLYRKQLDGGD